MIMVVNSVDWKGKDATCSPCRAPLFGAAGPPLSGARPSEAQAGLSTVHPGTVDSLTPGILISQYKDMTDRIFGNDYALLNASLSSWCVAFRNLPRTKQCSNSFT